MRVILSRVGVDSSTPEGADATSPLFSDGRFYSIPIPYPHSPIRYKDVQSDLEGIDTAAFASRFARKTGEDFVHLDPDLNRRSLSKRHPSWRPAYGQAGKAQSHLAKERVCVGDLFLFYGRFMPVVGPPWRRRKDAAFANGDFQAVWSWLRVGEMVPLNRERVPDGNADHPHAHGVWPNDNVLYIGAAELGLEGFAAVPGAGILPRLRPLTKPGGTASDWSFPREWFSKHRQEHVADCDTNPRVLSIALDLLSDLRKLTRLQFPLEPS